MRWRDGGRRRRGHRSRSVTDEKPGVIEPVLRGDASCRSLACVRKVKQQAAGKKGKKKHLGG